MTTTITIPPVTVVCCGTSFLNMMVMLAPTSVGQITLHQQDLVLPEQLISRDLMRVSAGLMHVPQQQPTQSQISSQAYAYYAMGPLWVGFTFRVGPPTNSYFIYSMSIVVFALCFHVPMWLPCSPRGSTIGVFDTATHGSLPLVGICAS